MAGTLDGWLLTVELALELGEHQGHGLGGSSGGGHNVERGRAGAAQVTVAGIQQPLVAGVAVRGGHGALHNAKLLVQDLHAAQKGAQCRSSAHIFDTQRLGLLFD
jgi:hypothetical protein